jgi:hypothetical protein
MADSGGSPDDVQPTVVMPVMSAGSDEEGAVDHKSGG